MERATPDDMASDVPRTGQRPDVQCEGWTDEGQCRVMLSWAWYVPSAEHHRRYARWFAPERHAGGDILCAQCATRTDDDLQRREIAETLKGWGVPLVSRGFRWGRPIRQPAEDDARLDDAWRHWAMWVLAENDGREIKRIGVSRANRTAAGAASVWSPDCGQWLMLEGIPGSGKSVWSSAIAARLAGIPQQLVQVTSEDLEAEKGRGYARRHEASGCALPYRRWGGWSCLWVQESELHAEERRFFGRSRRGSDEVDPIQRCETCHVLVLDDLGTAPKGEKWDDNIARILNVRYENKRPTVITTNLNMDDIELRYGLRTVDRLQEMTHGWHHVLERRSWRQMGAV